MIGRSLTYRGIKHPIRWGVSPRSRHRKHWRPKDEAGAFIYSDKRAGGIIVLHPEVRGKDLEELTVFLHETLHAIEHGRQMHNGHGRRTKLTHAAIKVVSEELALALTESGITLEWPE